MLTSTNRLHDRQFFYKYTSAETAKKILINKTLRFSSTLIFNDPFDVARKLKLTFSQVEFNKGLRDELIHLIQLKEAPFVHNSKVPFFLNYTSKLNSKQKEDIINLLRSDTTIPQLDEDKALEELQRQWEALMPSSRILSITEENDNPVMWWCYANEYSGVVIELESLDIYDSPLLLAKKVEYNDSLPTIGSIDYWIKITTGQAEFDYKKVFERLELTKTTHWAHEKEWRIISFDKNSEQLYSDYQMHPRTFSKIYFGENIDKVDREDIERLINFDLSHMEIYDMNLNYDSRQIQFERIKKIKT